MLFCALVAKATDPVDYVSTMMGTMSKYEISTGNTYPAVTMPWGMNSWTPMTGKRGDGWTYTYDANKITGLKLTHQPSPWINDYGQLIVMPFSGNAPAELRDVSSWFSHKAEKATPYYYNVYLAEYDVLAELAPTERAAAMRFNFRGNDVSSVLIDALDGDAAVNLSPNRTRITGYSTRNSGGVPENFRLYYVIDFDQPWTDSIAENKSLKAVSFGHSTCVNARVAASFISEEQAIRNLNELGESTLEEVAAAGRKAWNNELGKIEIEDDNLDRLRTFYSCLYRSLIFPRAFYEYDAQGKPVHYSPHTGEVLPGRMYTDTGFWDTFRALFPLLNLIYPERSAEVQEGMVNYWKESGFLPEWASPGHRGCMVGNNSASVVADAYLSGVKTPEIEELWKAVVHGAHAVHPQVSSTGRLGYEYYDELGYVPADKGINESAARTLEYAYDDWCIYQLGKALGKSEKELAPFAKNAYNYEKLFDKEHSLMHGRKADGEFTPNFSPYQWGGAFTEGNSWHYTWSVFHDPAGLAKLMGGEQKMAAMLDSVFNTPPVFDDSYYGGVIHEIREMQVMNMGNYAHGNQPIQHMIYLYDWVGQPWKTQERVREVMDKFYTPTPDGYCGDEDNGQTSAWYVFSALGFYPVCPGSGEYALGAPAFKKATINMADGKKVVITSEGDGVYVDGMTLNGKPYAKNYLLQKDLKAGADIDYKMSAEPNMKRGTTKDAYPYSFSTAKK